MHPPDNNNQNNAGLEMDVERALERMTDDERRRLAAWCQEQGMDERTAVVYLVTRKVKQLSFNLSLH